MVRAEDGRANSGWSGVCRFIVDQNVPSTPPDINSPEFPNGAGGKPEHTSPARTEGSFTFTPGQATGVKKYEYWSEWSQQRVTKDAEADGRLAVRLTPPAARPGPDLRPLADRRMVQPLRRADVPVLRQHPGYQGRPG